MKKKMKTVLIVAMSVALAACSGKGTPADGAAGADSAVASEKTITSENATAAESDDSVSGEYGINDIENFYEFFDKFKTDSVFQKERIKFPLKVVTVTYDEHLATAKRVIGFISHSEFGFGNLKELEDRGYRYRAHRVDEYEEVVTESSRDTSTRGSFRFRTYKGKWYLVARIYEIVR